MIKIGIITFQDGYNRGICDFYPLIRWQKKFKENDIEINFFKSHSDVGLLNMDVVGIDSRYYRTLTVIQNKYSDLHFVIEQIHLFKSKGIKVVLFDNDDSSGGRQWDLIRHVDILVKKQVLTNRDYYTLDNGVHNYKPFIKSYGLDISFDGSSTYRPCPPDQLHKIRLGWNIGMIDYRYFPLSYYYPIGTSRLLNSICKSPKFVEPSGNRPYDSSFRGKIKKNNKVYSYQRNKVIELLNDKNSPKFRTGDIISKRRYLQELKKSKITVSPFGWGEVCYRDFEAILNGSLLIKPDMSHLETYPDIFKENNTYIPVEWDMENLDESLNDILKDYEDYIPIIKNAQNLYKSALIDSKQFINHFISALKL